MTKRLTVAVHRVPESEDYEGGFEAVTLSGTPRGVVISSPGHGSAEDALENLLIALGEMGFAGTVRIEDATYLAGVQRYEAAIPAAGGKE